MKNYFRNISSVFILLATASLSFYSCTPTASEKESDVGSSTKRNYHISENDSANIAIVTSYLTSLLDGDGSVAKGLVSESFKSSGPAIGDSATIDQVVTQWATNATTRTNQKSGVITSIGLTVTEGPLLGDWVNVWGTYTAKDNKTGKDLIVPWHTVSKLENGKIISTRVWFDNLGPALAMGTVIPAK